MLADGVTMPKLRSILAEFDPDVVGLTMNTFQTRSAREVSRLVEEVLPRSLVVVGGPHPSSVEVEIFKDFPDIDVSVIGEGEHIFMEIIKGRNLEEIEGICYKGVMNPPREPADNLDYIPLPDLSLIDLSKFTGTYPTGAHPSMYIMASRGCPFRCSFCNKSIWGRTVRFRDPKKVVEEIRWLGENGVKEIYFQDDTFNVNLKWAKSLLQLMIDEGLNRELIYKTDFRANEELLDEDLLELAKKAGFWMIFYGVESGSQKVLDRMRKDLTVREIERAFALTHKFGIKTYGSFIVGMPGENKETLRETFDLLRRINPSYYGFAYATPFPGTDLHKEVSMKGQLFCNNYDDYAYGKCVIRTDDLTREELIETFLYYRSMDKARKMSLSQKVFKSLKHPRLAFKIATEQISQRIRWP